MNKDMVKDKRFLVASIVSLVENQAYMDLNKLIREQVEADQTKAGLNNLCAALKEAIKELYFNTNVEYIVYCEEDWGGRDIFLSETFSMAYSARLEQIILSSSHRNILVSEADNSIITSVGDECFIFVLKSNCDITVKGDNCFVYVAGDNNTVNIVGNDSNVVFYGLNSALILRGNSRFRGLAGSEAALVNKQAIVKLESKNG